VEVASVNAHVRFARPVSDLERASEMYCAGLGLTVLGSFADHQGFDGVMVGAPGASYHFEFTICRTHPVVPTPTVDDLLVLYLPELEVWRAACSRMLEAGFQGVASFNPYWDEAGRTFVDPDGYRVVLQHAAWQRT
jgi:catechol 2,3-dioxygenase-like lactoylglutathione lyase family enzyme